MSEPVTLCLNSVNMFSTSTVQDMTPPDLEATILSLAPPATSAVIPDTCRPTFNLCTRVAMDPASFVDIKVFQHGDDGIEGVGTAFVLGSLAVGGLFDRTIFAREHVDLGCFEPPPHILEPHRDVVLWVSLWYP